MQASAAIYGCQGLVLLPEERAFFRDAQPFGFILFARNCETPEQMRALCHDLRVSAGSYAPILIDQEGGRVQRLGPPHWPVYPPGAVFSTLYDTDSTLGLAAARLSARLIAADLADLGGLEEFGQNHRLEHPARRTRPELADRQIDVEIGHLGLVARHEAFAGQFQHGSKEARIGHVGGANLPIDHHPARGGKIEHAGDLKGRKFAICLLLLRQRNPKGKVGNARVVDKRPLLYSHAPDGHVAEW